MIIYPKNLQDQHFFKWFKSKVSHVKQAGQEIDDDVLVLSLPPSSQATSYRSIYAFEIHIWFLNQVMKTATNLATSCNVSSMEGICETAWNAMRSVRCASKRGRIWKHLIGPHLPIGPQLALIMQSSLFCHEILEMWRNNQEWLGKAAGDFVDPIKFFWDGSKVRLCQNFWNPAATWELPVVCPQCKTSHKAFPRKCEELLDPRNWDESSQVYKFLCRQCRHLMVSPKQMLQVEFQ